MAFIDITARIEGSSKASVVPVRVMAVSASLSGQSSAGPKKPQPPKNEKPNKTGAT